MGVLDPLHLRLLPSASHPIPHRFVVMRSIIICTNDYIKISESHNEGSYGASLLSKEIITIEKCIL